jgi:hypothetical protein
MGLFVQFTLPFFYVVSVRVGLDYFFPLLPGVPCLSPCFPVPRTMLCLSLCYSPLPHRVSLAQLAAFTGVLDNTPVAMYSPDSNISIETCIYRGPAPTSTFS